MSAILQVGNQQIAAEQFVSLLKSSQLLPQLLREFFIEQAVSSIEYTPEELEHYCQQQAQKPENYGLSSQKLQLTAPRQFRLEKFKEVSWGHQVEATFYNCREQLDRVLFSLIQSEDVEVIQELYFRLQEGEASFARLASQYSQGPEAHTNGLVGPIELNNLHPKLAQVLKVSQPGQISPPIRVDKWLVIVRLERYIPAQFDDKMRQRLLDELFEAWLQEKIAQQSGSVNLRAPAEFPPMPLNEDLAEVEEPGMTLSEAELPSEPQTRALPAKQGSTSKIATTLMLCLIPFGLGILTVEGFSRLTAKSDRAPQPPATPLPATADVAAEDAFREAVNHAMKAAVLTQTAQSQSEWQLVAGNWQRAVVLMQQVPSSHPDYPTAQDKVGEYENYLNYAQGMLSKSVDAFHEAVNNAMKAATLTQTAQSLEDWNTVAEGWQKAIAFMQAVPSNNPNYQVARDKVGEYQRNLEYAQSKAEQRELGS